MARAHGRKSDLLAFGSRVILHVGTSMKSNREFDAFAFELATEGDRLHRGGV